MVELSSIGKKRRTTVADGEAKLDQCNIRCGVKSNSEVKLNRYNKKTSSDGAKLKLSNIKHGVKSNGGAQSAKKKGSNGGAKLNQFNSKCGVKSNSGVQLNW